LVLVCQAQNLQELRVAVVDSQHKSIAGATVEVNGLDKLTTNADGVATFTALQPADYQVSVSKPGFQTIEKVAVRVASSEPA